MTYWRKRLAASDRPHRIFETIREVITATGAVAGKQWQALDSTVLDDAVARQDTITQLIALIRRVGRDVPGAVELVAKHCTRLAEVTGQDYTATGRGGRAAGPDPVGLPLHSARFHHRLIRPVSRPTQACADGSLLFRARPCARAAVHTPERLHRLTPEQGLQNMAFAVT